MAGHHQWRTFRPTSCPSPLMSESTRASTLVCENVGHWGWQCHYWRLAFNAAESKRYPTYLSWKSDGGEASNLFNICLISLAVCAMRCLFVLPVQRCGACVSKPKGHGDTTNVRNLSDRLNENVFGDLTTCKFCVPNKGPGVEDGPKHLRLMLWLLPPATYKRAAVCRLSHDFWPVKVSSWTTDFSR